MPEQGIKKESREGDAEEDEDKEKEVVNRKKGKKKRRKEPKCKIGRRGKEDVERRRLRKDEERMVP